MTCTELLNARLTKDRSRAQQLLQAGELVAVPTETVYGLAADASNPDAVAKIFTAKQRPANHPLIVHLSKLEQLDNWAENIPPAAYKLVSKFWPGPLTLLLQKARHVSSLITGGRQSIALRMPEHPLLLELLSQINMAVAAPSANLHKKLSPVRAEQVMESMQGRLAAVLDGGPCRFGIESTIIDLRQRPFKLLRSGPLTRKELEEVLEELVLLPIVHDVAIPGNMADHYQPRTPLLVCKLTQLSELCMKYREKKVMILRWSKVETLSSDLALTCHEIFSMPQDKNSYAALLYDTLHSVDGSGFDLILLEQPPQTEEWLDVNDRLQRATYKRAIE